MRAVELVGALGVVRCCRGRCVVRSVIARESQLEAALGRLAGSIHRVVTTLPRVKKWTPSVPWAWVSPNSERFQPPKE